MIGTLGELASLPGMPSEPTLRKMIDGDPEFAGIIKRAKGKGDAFEIDLVAAARYVQSLDDKRREAERDRQTALGQLGLDMGLGGVVSSAPGVSIADRKALLEEEVIAIKLARQRGELVVKATIEAAIGQLLVWHQQHQSGFSARLAKRVDLDRAAQIEVDAMIAADLADFARRIRKIGEIEATDDGDGSNLAPAALEDTAL